MTPGKPRGYRNHTLARLEIHRCLTQASKTVISAPTLTVRAGHPPNCTRQSAVQLVYSAPSKTYLQEKRWWWWWWWWWSAGCLGSIRAWCIYLQVKVNALPNGNWVKWLQIKPIRAKEQCKKNLTIFVFPLHIHHDYIASLVDCDHLN